jgi:transcriptional regulator with XRE-family HTH domain
MNTVFAKNFKVIKEHLGKNAEELGKLFGVKRTSVENYLRGYEAKPPVIQKICNYLSITQDQLLSQKLTPEDFNMTGRVQSITEVKLESALRENKLLRDTIKDLRRIISEIDRKK